jgi:dCTP deaminase
MKKKKIGVLPSQKIRELILKGHIKGAKMENIRPASLDLSISEKIFRVNGIFQPRVFEKIEDILEKIEAENFDLKYPLEKDVTYIVKLNESLNLPKDIYAFSNPKSSTGRNDIQVRMLADNVPRFDAAFPGGFKGELYLAICPKSFPIKLQKDETLIQIRFFNLDTRFSEKELCYFYKKYQLLWKGNKPLDYSELKISDRDGSLILTANLSQKIVGWKCLGLNKVLDFSKRYYYQPEDFFEPIFSNKDKKILLKKDNFYILSTKEAIRVPPELTCEIVPMDHRSGEFRSHYAGFFDPGWGWGKRGEGKGRPAVLEVRPFEDIILRDNQPICKFRFEKMIDIPDLIYDKINSHYLDQKGARLSKHFKKFAKTYPLD